MSSPDDLLFGQLAAKRALATTEDVKLCLQLQAEDEKTGAQRRTLGAIMVARGLITPAQVKLILETQRELAGPRKIGKYELLLKLGEGGMGVVYKAVAPESRQQVALKVLSDKYASNPAYVTRFRMEASAGLQLRHPHIVRTLDVGANKGVLFIALELVEGGDLEKLIRARGVIPVDEALSIVRKVALGLQHAFAAGLIHRDIKPANILFSADGQPKISDFGLVKMLDVAGLDLTQPGVTVGTPHYISPEQIRGEKDIDVGVDIYALGITLYRMVTGRRPFDGATTVEVITKHLHEQPIAADKVNPRIGGGCAAIIQKMMAKARAERYEQPSELIHDIDLVASGKAPEYAAAGAPKELERLSNARDPQRIAAHSAIEASTQPSDARTRAWFMRGAIVIFMGIAAILAFQVFRKQGSIASQAVNKENLSHDRAAPAAETVELFTRKEHFADWIVFSPAWRVENGMLIGKGLNKNAYISRGDALPADFDLSFFVEPMNGAQFHICWQQSVAKTAGTDCGSIRVDPQHQVFLEEYSAEGQGSIRQITKAAKPFPTGIVLVRVIVVGRQVRCFLNHELFISSNEALATWAQRRALALFTWSQGGETRFSKIVARPARMDDLTDP